MDFLWRGRDTGCVASDDHRLISSAYVNWGLGIRMTDLVDIAIPANAQPGAEALGLVVSRSVTDGARVRRIRRDEAEIAVACLHDYGVAARIIEIDPPAASGESRAT